MRGGQASRASRGGSQVPAGRAVEDGGDGTSASSVAHRKPSSLPRVRQEALCWQVAERASRQEARDGWDQAVGPRDWGHSQGVVCIGSAGLLKMNVRDILIRNEACVYCGLARKQAFPHLSLQPPVHTGCTQATSGITAGSVASSLGPDSDKGPGVPPRSWASRGEQVTLGPLSQAVWVTVEVPGPRPEE